MELWKDSGTSEVRVMVLNVFVCALNNWGLEETWKQSWRPQRSGDWERLRSWGWCCWDALSVYRFWPWDIPIEPRLHQWRLWERVKSWVHLERRLKASCARYGWVVVEFLQVVTNSRFRTDRNPSGYLKAKNVFKNVLLNYFNMIFFKN